MLEEKKSFEFIVNSLRINADYYIEDIDNIFLPLIERLKKIHEEKGKRVIVYMAAPPGVGKSTLSMFLEYLSKNDEKTNCKIQAIGMDGFHYKQDYIKSHNAIVDGIEVPMKKVKGCPETFDLKKLENKVSMIKNNDILWPIYDRKLHDVVEDQVLVNGDIIIIEGNWLLLNEQGWDKLQEYCDYSIFIKADESILKDRLINRKIMGGLSEEEAKIFYENSDRKNIYRVLNNKSKSDLELSLSENGKYTVD